jgi:hypothetical protein
MYDMDREFRNRVNRAASEVIRSMARYVETPSLLLSRALMDAIIEFKTILNSDDVELSRAIYGLEMALVEASEKHGNEAEGGKLAGSFPTPLTYLVTQELNRRKISYTLKEHDSFITNLYVPSYSIKEAVAIMNELKQKHKRIRI